MQMSGHAEIGVCRREFVPVWRISADSSILSTSLQHRTHSN